MLRLSKKVDYGLIAMRHIAMNSHNRLVSAREISEHNRINYDLLAKILQKLARAGVITSHQGAHGGYILALPANQITLCTVIEAIDGPMSIIECEVEKEEHNCMNGEICTVRNPLRKVQHGIRLYLAKVTVSEIM